ncbi:MAG: hypothetical protein JSU65_07490 [Candidatus Zixiibacteriota bacterium]|nr:MAG: hypothetical protein JSU65_07490 [candidate division Zixibacteria bacterium]
MSKQSATGNKDERPVPAILLAELIKKYYEVLLERAAEDAKIGDLIKMIELHRKVAPDQSAQKKLWDSLEKIRKEVLGGKNPEKATGSNKGRRKTRKS